MVLAVLVCLLVLYPLVQCSFFFDGNIYAAIARNLSQGSGTVWAPRFSETLFKVFAEHPPLGIWLESLGFLILGDHIAVEKTFSFLTLIVSGWLLFRLWMTLHDGDEGMQRAAPLALGMTLVAGRVDWAFGNGMLENLLCVFALASVLMIVTAYTAGPSGLRRACMLGAALATICAVMVKGPVGLFPLAAPLLYRLSFRKPGVKRVLLDIAFAVLVLTGVFLIFWCFDAPREAILRYFTIQLMPSLNGARGHAGGGWRSISTFLRVCAYPAIITVAILVLTRKIAGARASELTLKRRRNAIFLLLVGCSASIPLLVSPRVSSFYFNPSLMFIAPGFCCLCGSALTEALERIGSRTLNRLWFVSAACLFLSFSGLATVWGGPGKDGLIIENAARIAQVVCEGRSTCEAKIAACPAVWQDWALHAYLQRNHKISMAQIREDSADYLIFDATCDPVPGYRKTDIDIAPYALLSRK